MKHHDLFFPFLFKYFGLMINENFETGSVINDPLFVEWLVYLMDILVN